MRGEVAATSLAAQVVRRYRRLGDDERIDFFGFLLTEMGPDAAAVDAAIAAYRAEPGPLTVQDLAAAAEAPRLVLFRSLNTAPGGIDSILSMRADALEAARSDPDLVPVERDLGHILGSWFNRGFLRLDQIDWRTPATVLEKLIAYEAVHEIRGWDDLRRRLARDRRCFGFFHPLLPDEPVIFVEVALTRELPSSIQTLLDSPIPPDDAPDDYESAIFYSITNCQEGLRGIPLGNFLIKQVTEELEAALPELKLFSTLSPIPGYVRWVRATGGGLTDEVAGLVTSGCAEIDPGLEEVVTGSCARYLLEAKRDGEPLDPVARFHLRNGARLERINWAGDVSTKGLEESYGMLVNYVYDPDELAENHEAYANEYTIAHSEAVAALVDPASP
jgi:malonyl-CoA decarboxylase